MKIILPTEKDKNLFDIDKNKFESITFIFAQYQKNKDEYVYIFGLIKYNDNSVRIDMRYYNTKNMTYFLKITQTLSIFNEITEFIKNAENFNQIENKLHELKTSGKIIYDVFTKQDLSNYPVVSWNDYTISDLALNEPKIELDEDLLKKYQEDFFKNFKFEGREKSNKEKILEQWSKYIRKGPSHLYKVNVKPVKKWVKCANGKMCWRTYYIGVNSNNVSKIKTKQQVYDHIMNKALTREAEYYNEILPKYQQTKVTDENVKKYLGENFTIDYGGLSGNAYTILNNLQKRYDDAGIIKKIHDQENDISYYKFNDGTELISSFKLGEDGRFGLYSIMQKKDEKGGIIKKKENGISGVIHVNETEDGYKIRTMIIDNMHNYDVDSFSSFMIHSMYKFDGFFAKTENLSVNDVSILLLNGFGDNIKIDENIKNIIMQSLDKHVKSEKRKQKIIAALNNPENSNLAQIFLHIVKSGSTNANKLSKDIAAHIKKNYDYLRFSVAQLDANGKFIFNTDSVNTIHSEALQRNAENDYHKGFKLRFKK